MQNSLLPAHPVLFLCMRKQVVLLCIGVGYIYYGDEINLPGETGSKQFANPNFARYMQWTNNPTSFGFTENATLNLRGSLNPANITESNAMVCDTCKFSNCSSTQYCVQCIVHGLFECDGWSSSRVILLYSCYYLYVYVQTVYEIPYTRTIVAKIDEYCTVHFIPRYAVPNVDG